MIHFKLSKQNPKTNKQCQTLCQGNLSIDDNHQRRPTITVSLNRSVVFPCLGVCLTLSFYIDGLFTRPILNLEIDCPVSEWIITIFSTGLLYVVHHTYH